MGNPILGARCVGLGNGEDSCGCWVRIRTRDEEQPGGGLGDAGFDEVVEPGAG